MTRRNVALLVSLAVLAPAGGVPARAAEPSNTAGRRVAAQTAYLTQQTAKLTKSVEKLETIEYVILGPIAVLVGVLALGGGLGIVFSIRDQRRISQMHELSVAGEISSQRRTEQSYGSFLEQSQTTIALVNDTLKLAKDASDREARSLESKAKSRVDAVEERAERLMLQMFRVEDFELLVDNRDHRGELHAIGEQLRAFETYLSFQDLSLPPYSSFVKAIDQFLLDDTASAIHELTRASQDRQIVDLHRFTLYWLGYMLTTVGEYREAIARFRDDEVGLPDDDAERLQLERMIAETEFFVLAKHLAEPSQENDERGTPRDTPGKRFELVADILDHLSELAQDVRNINHSHVSLEIAQTRADLYTWVAYDHDRLDDPLEERTHGVAKRLPLLPLYLPRAKSQDTQERPPGPARRFTQSGDWSQISSPDEVRAWALMQATAICEEEARQDHDLNFYVSFALAECYFMLEKQRTDHDVVEVAFRAAEGLLRKEFGDFRERRRNATLFQSLLICHSRLYKLAVNDDQKRREETRDIQRAAREASQAVQEMRQGKVTIFSQIQRRNISQDEFNQELDDIVEQEHIRAEDQAA